MLREKTRDIPPSPPFSASSGSRIPRGSTKVAARTYKSTPCDRDFSPARAPARSYLSLSESGPFSPFLSSPTLPLLLVRGARFFRGPRRRNSVSPLSLSLFLSSRSSPYGRVPAGSRLGLTYLYFSLECDRDAVHRLHRVVGFTDRLVDTRRARQRALSDP